MQKFIETTDFNRRTTKIDENCCHLYKLTTFVSSRFSLCSAAQAESRFFIKQEDHCQNGQL